MNIFSSLNVERFLFSLQYMWKGMLCIFIVIAIIILSITIMNSITNKLEKKKQSDNDK